MPPTHKKNKSKSTASTATTSKVSRQVATVDLLDRDKPIDNQNFACISFVSPENIIKAKEEFIFEQFVKSWDFNKSMSKFNEFLNFLSNKYHIKIDGLMDDYKEFIEIEKPNLFKDVTWDYKTYKEINEDKLNDHFNKEHEFKTSVRGLKIRGVFNTKDEAEMRAKLLREVDPWHHIFVGEVGAWLPWDPDPHKTGNVIYVEKELNELMHEKQKNEALAKQEFDARVKNAKETAIEENKKKAAKTHNVLSQTLNEDGELVDLPLPVNPNNTLPANTLNKEILSNATGTSTQEDIKNIIFNNSNVVLPNASSSASS